MKNKEIIDPKELLTMLATESHNAHIQSRVPDLWKDWMIQRYRTDANCIRQLVREQLVRESGVVQQIPCIHSEDLPDWMPADCRVGPVVIGGFRQTLFAMHVGYSDDGKLTDWELVAAAASLPRVEHCLLNPQQALSGGRNGGLIS